MDTTNSGDQAETQATTIRLLEQRYGDKGH